ncbi:MAG: phytanoyl-CoA dioxygenase family protein [Acidiferrobacteraceae bacterium]|jgi:ectoine hydroxylase-related dioxygenase (phytanoyl-CoA dioxygenase family)|nr:phytanoyl-CoA dioxygenase family protein [Acidiferrobacteraceae bacterium]MDP6398247.1 phytanoyl-CoA dioxygenase family protein [Arenicellales bacterium]MDP6552084.1 phytanoyl-CoA dioxygenase family protein [Arenicellales bacterium]MDP6791596.1 phytanoyl-CoA dioxygenase family protein [Arenicellales bacterium]MDP6918030.1 phytanoyl-CoA dioxygenase family protein [Arenicellales bacterium]|tara:strand:+ start:1183 stop:1995 length:813 start_codon:yes stop_codon:yes gene_type:complete
MTSTGSQTRAEKYFEDGFLGGIEVLSPEETAAHRRQLEDAERQIGHALHYHSKVHTVLRSPFELATHPALVDVVEEILGPDILLYNVTYIIKEPQTAKFVSWHQDLTYWGFDGTKQVSTWLALSPATATSGCMQMIPGSHRQGLHEQVTSDDPDNVLLQSQTIENVREEDAVLCPLAPGEASIHHGWTIHASRPNTSADRRIGLNIQYITPGMCQTKVKTDSAMLIRGQDRFGHFETDYPADEWLPDDAEERLLVSTRKYHAISGSPNPA